MLGATVDNGGWARLHTLAPAAAALLLLTTGCPNRPGVGNQPPDANPAFDSAVVDASIIPVPDAAHVQHLPEVGTTHDGTPPPPLRLVLLHTADTAGWIEPCG